MKWNFECETERRDYLHNCIARRLNGFRAAKNVQGYKFDAIPAASAPFMLCSRQSPLPFEMARRSLLAHQNIQTAILLTAIRLVGIGDHMKRAGR
jgi:hypothetical protein